MSSLAHLIAFSNEVNNGNKVDLQDPNGPMKHLEAFRNASVQEALEREKNKIKGLVGVLMSRLDDIYRMDRAFGSNIKNRLINADLIDIETMDPEPEVEAAPAPKRQTKGKEKEPQGPAMVCGCITKDKKKPCQRRGVAEYGGRCGHHKNSEGPRVTSVETVVVAAEPKSEPMAPMDPGPSEPPVPMTTTKAKVKTAPAEIEEDPEEVERRQADFTEEERQMVADMTRQMGMVGEDGEVLHEELEEWDPFDGEEEEEEDVESDEVDYE
jgi:hypothetical protein